MVTTLPGIRNDNPDHSVSAASGGFSNSGGWWLALPQGVKHWSLTTLKEKLIKIGAKIVRHARAILGPVGLGELVQHHRSHRRPSVGTAGFRQSMSRADNCYDNAFMESCFGTLKTELEMTEYQDCRAARRRIAEYVHYYLHCRKHSALGYLTPAQFERSHRT